MYHSNVEFGGEDEDCNALKLIPKVLECVHRYGNERPRPPIYEQPLSIPYEILRSWKMPEYTKQFMTQQHCPWLHCQMLA